MDLYKVVFEGNDLSSLEAEYGIELLYHDFNNYPTQILNKYKIARSNKSVITSALDGDKSIEINFRICGGGRSDTEYSMRYLKALLNKLNGALVVNQAGQEVRYTATVNEFNHEWVGTTAWVTIVFETSDPIGTETLQQTLVDTTITSQTASFPVTIGGSSEAEPAFYLYIGSVSGGTNQTISVKNGKTGEGIYITKNFAANDNITIDSEKMVIIINGEYTDFSGIFPTFDTGPQSITYSDTFTSRSVSFVSKYYMKNS